MSDSPPPPPAGWYQSDSGQRYWDGSKWLTREVPVKIVTVPTAQKKRVLWPWLIVAVIVAVLGILELDAWVGGQRQLQAEQAAERTAKQEAERVARAEHLAAMKKLGWSEWGQGLFYQFLDTDEFSCDLFDCTKMIVLAEDGCDGGIYGEVALLSGDLSVGYANDITSTLSPDAQALLVFEDPQDLAERFSLTELRCMGE